MRGKPLPVTERAAFARDWAAGMPVIELGRKYGISQPAVSNRARRLNLPARRPPPLSPQRPPA